MAIATGKANTTRHPAKAAARDRAPASPTLDPGSLQQTIGNRALLRLVQAKLAVSQRDDPFEREADRAAEVVLRSPATPFHCGDACPGGRNTDDERVVDEALPGDEPPIVQTKLTVPPAPAAVPSTSQGANLKSETHEQLARATAGGEMLPLTVRTPMERAFGADFSGVRIHTGSAAHDLSLALQAHAFTTGQHIFFRQGAYDPGGASGARLLAHELTHVIQQTGPDVRGAPPRSVATPTIQRQLAAPAPVAAAEDIPEDEPRRHRWLNYDRAIEQNRVWFRLLRLEAINPFAPHDPFYTPNAFVHRVLRWQQAADRAEFAKLVFAAEEAQRQVRSGSLASVATGIEEVLRKLRARERVEPGRRVAPDGVLGPRTFWMMLVAAALSTSKKGRQGLQRLRIPLEPLAGLTEEKSEAWGEAWRAVHAYLFNPAELRANWSPLVRSDVVFRVYQEQFGYTDDDFFELDQLFFPEGRSPDVSLDDDDLTAILSRGYADEALEGIVSVVEVDRTYFRDVDMRKVIETRKRKWLQAPRVIQMGTAVGEEAKDVMAEFGLGTPTGAQADAAVARLVTQGDWQHGVSGPVSVLIAAFKLPPKPEGFWAQTASRYVAERALLERAAEEATQAHLRELEQRYQQRMAGTPDIGSTPADAVAFLELLVGPAFESAQRKRMEGHATQARGIDIDISARWHHARQGPSVNTLLARANRDQFLVVQLSDKRDERFPLSLRQIQRSRQQAADNGAAPLVFDLIDTPQAAFHYFSPTRFSARPHGKKGEAQVASNPYKLVEGGLSWESWRHRPGRIYAQLEPILVEMREFNPDAGKLVQWYRQLIGTDRITVRFVWTLGGAIVPLAEALWKGQTRVNIAGWVDAVLTTVALGSVVAAPLGAAAGGGAAVGGQVVRATAMAAARRALVGALRRFVVSEAIGEALGRITYALNDDESVPEAVKTIWNGLMVALLVYGIGSTVRQGIKSFKTRASVRFQRDLAALEAALDEEAKTAGRAKPSAADVAAQADIRERTAARHRELVGQELGGAPATGAGRVRSTDPRAAAVAGEAPGVRLLTPEHEARLRQVLGADAADALAGKATDATRRRLALIESDEALRRLHNALSGEELATALARLDAPTLARLGAALDPAVLRTLLTALMGSVKGIRLLRVFWGDGPLLARLMDRLSARTLLALADDPGPERLLRLAGRADADAILDALRNMGSHRTQGLDRFRQMVRDIGPEATADVLNTYAGWEIRNRWRRGSGAHAGLSPAQNVGRLAIQRRLEPTRGRQRTGVPVPAAPTRPQTFSAGDIPSFYAIGPEATAPAALREQVTALKVATARAATQLDGLMHRAAQGTLTPAEIQALPPNARATVEAFLRTGPADANHHALYGSALQYLAEFKLAEMFGGALPPGVAIRRREYRVGQTLIPDAQIEITLAAELRYPQRNTVERAVIDWTTAGEAGKIAKYRGGTPPVTYAVELIQPGPPRQQVSPTAAPTPLPTTPVPPPTPAPSPVVPGTP